MEWLNLKISLLRSSQYIGSTPVERATWINVLAWCCEQENNGLIAGGAQWKDRQWQQTCGVTAREVRSADKLIVIHDTDLEIFGYPTDKQDQVQTRRLQAAEAARTRWHKQIGIAPRTANHDADRNASRIPTRNAPRNAEGEEEGELEVERNATHANPTTTPPQKIETDSDWLARLVSQYPALDIPAELAKAERKKAGPVERPWFEKHWLPAARPTYRRTKTQNQTAIPETFPAWFDREYPDPAPGIRETYLTGPWTKIPREIREKFNNTAVSQPDTRRNPT